MSQEDRGGGAGGIHLNIMRYGGGWFYSPTAAEKILNRQEQTSAWSPERQLLRQDQRREVGDRKKSHENKTFYLETQLPVQALMKTSVSPEKGTLFKSR